ncbi:hypothetical protein OG474_14795 [Kribbella sp. NBC_01505]|uniref:TPR repeat region-containing protein n=1 Tax=Kribbella sp. NBC_01505 TaxID=2903580 RepID=UPI00386E6491
MAYKDEGGSHGAQADGFCMIDPVVLGGVISDLATMESAIGAELKGLKGEFEKVGVSTQPITDLTGVASWLHGELPMLRRRHAAAVLLASQRMQPVAGTHMLSMSEDPAVATKDAGNLAVQQIKAALDGKPPGRDGVVDAIRALERIRNSKGALGQDDLLFLETFYKGLGKDLYKVPGYLKNDDNWIAPTRTTYTPGEIIPTGLDIKTRTTLAASLVGGLLTLSDERRGGNWNRLPEFIQQGATDRYTEYVHEGSGAGEMSGGEARELAKFLSNARAGDHGGVTFSKVLAITATESVKEYLKVGGADDEPSRIFLQIAGNNEQAMHDMLTGKGMDPPAGVDKNIYKGYKGAKDFLVPISTYAWTDDGKAASSVFDWIADAKTSHDPTRQALANESMRSLVTTLARPDVLKQLMDMPGAGIGAPEEALGVINPELTRALARDAAGFMNEFSAGGAKTFVVEGVDNMYSGEMVAARFFTLVATDDKSAEALAGAVYRNNVDGIHQAMTDEEHAGDLGRRNAQLQGLLDTALRNAALEETDSRAAAEENMAEVRGNALGVVGTMLDAIPGMPGGVEGSIGIADKILDRYLSTETPTVEPYQIRTYGIDSTAYSSPGLITRYEFAKALVETGKLDPEDLPSAVRSNDIPPRLKSPAEFEAENYSVAADSYDEAVARTSSGALQAKFMKHHSEVYDRAIANFRAEDREQLHEKLGIG